MWILNPKLVTALVSRVYAAGPTEVGTPAAHHGIRTHNEKPLTTAVAAGLPASGSAEGDHGFTPAFPAQP